MFPEAIYEADFEEILLGSADYLYPTFSLPASRLPCSRSTVVPRRT